VTTVALGRGLSVLINPADVAAVADGVLVNAVWAVGQMAARPRESRRTAAGLDTAAWADTERLIRDALADVAARREFPVLSEQDAAELAVALRRHEVQGALQALLAVRLTDAPEVDAVKAREAVRLALSRMVPTSPRHDDRRRGVGVPLADDGRSSLRATARSEEPLMLAGFEAAGSKYAAPLSEYFDDKICGLVATLEGRVGFAGLAQVRAEAYNARIVALLGAIERQVAALADSGRYGRDEIEFLERYRRQAHQRHGFLVPPDFDRRRRVRVADIYVATGVTEEDYSERPRVPLETAAGSLKVWDLAGRLDRTVLLGDPGGGKTTAANVLTDYFASDATRRIPFLVTLREYAAKTPIEWSVAECIEQSLGTLYQSPAPGALVERLLLTGRAVVIFDGLDELLDTSRRRDVSDRVEQFCSAYPLTPVLVTSRVVGYDQARLDDAQFTCYRLGGFGDDEVTEYARKWFASQEGIPAAEAAGKAQAFLAESAHATDLRANPLLLSLMCILYRGAGSLPGDRAGIYARCADLLLRKWDEQRDLYRRLGSDHLVEPTLRYLAWWLFTREDSQAAATERELIAKTTEFLYERGYETQEQARAAAREFVEFCRGRMWVFSDAGTTADGERLYGFTHRTFMEYFTAWHLAVTSESPEELARILAPCVGSGGWAVVSELAIKIKGGMSDRGVDRCYAALLLDQGSTSPDSALLEFLCDCLSSARPAPSTVRNLTRAVLEYATDRGEPVYRGLGSLRALLRNGDSYARLIADELGSRIAEMTASDQASVRTGGIRLLLSIPDSFDIGSPFDMDNSFWGNWLSGQVSAHRAEVFSAAERDQDVRIFALAREAITAEDALAMPGGLTTLATVGPVIFEEMDGDHRSAASHRHPYLMTLAALLREGIPRSTTTDATAAIGHYLLRHKALPWVRGRYVSDYLASDWIERIIVDLVDGLPDNAQLKKLDEAGKLGVTATLCILVEIGQLSARDRSYYVALPGLAIPVELREVFRDWAAGRVNFVEFVDEKPTS
jgi:NACHT domain